MQADAASLGLRTASADLARRLDRDCPQAGFIPEIWMGHAAGGQGFWTALERLEAWF